MASSRLTEKVPPYRRELLSRHLSQAALAPLSRDAFEVSKHRVFYGIADKKQGEFFYVFCSRAIQPTVQAIIQDLKLENRVRIQVTEELKNFMAIEEQCSYPEHVFLGKKRAGDIETLEVRIQDIGECIEKSSIESHIGHTCSIVGLTSEIAEKTRLHFEQNREFEYSLRKETLYEDETCHVFGIPIQRHASGWGFVCRYPDMTMQDLQWAHFFKQAIDKPVREFFTFSKKQGIDCVSQTLCSLQRAYLELHCSDIFEPVNQAKLAHFFARMKTFKKEKNLQGIAETLREMLSWLGKSYDFATIPANIMMIPKITEPDELLREIGSHNSVRGIFVNADFAKSNDAGLRDKLVKMFGDQGYYDESARLHRYISAK